MKKYQQLEHTTDLKLQIFGKNLNDLFANAAFALFDSIETRSKLPRKFNPVRKINLQSTDRQALLVDWLSELLYLHDVYNENYFKITINKISKTNLEAEVAGINCRQDKFDVKAVTYHQLEIKQTVKGFEAVVIFDI